MNAGDWILVSIARHSNYVLCYEWHSTYSYVRKLITVCFTQIISSSIIRAARVCSNQTKHRAITKHKMTLRHSMRFSSTAKWSGPIFRLLRTFVLAPQRSTSGTMKVERSVSTSRCSGVLPSSSWESRSSANGIEKSLWIVRARMWTTVIIVR